MDKYTITTTAKDIENVLDRTRKLGNIPMQLQYDILHTIKSLTAKLDSLRKAYAVTNESWKKLAEENEELKKINKRYDQDRINNQQLWGEACTDVLELQQENEQLRQREVINIKAMEDIKKYLHNEDYGSAWTVVKELLSATAPEYHNPEDVKALKMAREAIQGWMSGEIVTAKSMVTTFREAIFAIDALGVGE